MHKEHFHGNQAHDSNESHVHSHGLVDPSIIRSKRGLKAVGLSLAVLMLTGIIQVIINYSTNSVALLSDLIHNFGDALTAVPVGIAFILQSKYGERLAGYFVVFAIFISAGVALFQTIQRLIEPKAPEHLLILAAGGLIGFLGNELAGIIRTQAGKNLHSPALIADGKHARADGLVSLGVIISAILVSLGFPIADPLVGLIITALIFRITWQSWQIIRTIK